MTVLIEHAFVTRTSVCRRRVFASANAVLSNDQSHGDTTVTTRQTISAALFALSMAIASTIAYAIITHVLAPFVDKSDDLLGGMWAVIATVFVFRDTRVHSFSAGVARLVATTLSMGLCLLYLLIFPFSGLGMAAVIGLGTFVIMLLGWPDDIITTGITTAVVLVVARISPENAWHQPLLRFADTLVGIAVGVSCRWIAAYVVFAAVGARAR
jgi:uncharacterized membrane protein YgaE (UPF0421/DUF939 family)